MCGGICRSRAAVCHGYKATVRFAFPALKGFKAAARPPGYRVQLVSLESLLKLEMPLKSPTASIATATSRLRHSGQLKDGVSSP